MADLRALLSTLNLPELALALDTGHAHLASDLGTETLAAGPLLRSTHVHDNFGRRDTHDPPGRGTIDWPAWGRSLDEIAYAGPIMLECVRQLRGDPSLLDTSVLQPLLFGQPAT
jgi:sugar phosphate isomerase/epimerase